MGIRRDLFCHVCNLPYVITTHVETSSDHLCSACEDEEDAELIDMFGSLEDAPPPARATIEEMRKDPVLFIQQEFSECLKL